MKFIAEISSNHNRDIERIYKMIDSAKECGCWGVKFQLFKIEELFSPEILLKSKMHRDRKEWELPNEFIPLISKYCKSKKIKLGFSPFYIDSIKILDKYVDFFKIASYELLWHDILVECAKTNKPLIISTGMASIEEIEQAVKAIELENKKIDLTILHCNSSYHHYSEANLASIGFKLKI